MSQALNNRLQVLVDDARLSSLSAAAAREGVSAGEWVRRAIDDALADDGRADARRQLRELIDSTSIDFGTIDDIRKEIERSHVPGPYLDEFDA